MSHISLKKLEDLRFSEKQQITTLIHKYYPGDNFLKHKFLEEDNQMDIVLLKNEHQLLGISFYKTSYLLTPYSSNKLPVIHFSMALKSPLYKGNLIWKLGFWYAKRFLGLLFPFRKSVGIMTVVSPKVLESFSKLYPESLKDASHSCSTEKYNFLQDYLKAHYGIKESLHPNLSFETQTSSEINITQHWNKYYRAQNEAINTLFFERGILRKEGDQIYKTSKRLVISGYRNPLKWNKNIIAFGVKPKTTFSYPKL